MGGIEGVEDVSGQEYEIDVFPVSDLADFVQYELLLFETGVFLKSLSEVPIGGMEDF